jgi:hypothetical protein
VKANLKAPEIETHQKGSKTQHGDFGKKKVLMILIIFREFMEIISLAKTAWTVY